MEEAVWGFALVATDTHRRTQTILPADSADKMVQALQRRINLRRGVHIIRYSIMLNMLK